MVDFFVKMKKIKKKALLTALRSQWYTNIMTVTLPLKYSTPSATKLQSNIRTEVLLGQTLIIHYYINICI